MTKRKATVNEPPVWLDTYMDKMKGLLSEIGPKPVAMPEFSVPRTG
jgi:hypothetical protein